MYLFQDVFCGYDEDKVYTYIFYRDTVIGENYWNGSHVYLWKDLFLWNHQENVTSWSTL